MKRFTHSSSLCAITLAAMAAGGQSWVAAAPPGSTVADFTRRVQPLLINRCANGACHGSPGSPAPRIERGDVAGRIDRTITLANMEAILAACGPVRDPATLVATISGRHPASATSPHQLATPLSPRERATLEGWLRTALTARTFAQPAAASSSGSNRFQKLLDTAANPPPLPPPEEPRGLRIE